VIPPANISPALEVMRVRKGGLKSPGTQTMFRSGVWPCVSC
jgi:hypothetical protein